MTLLEKITTNKRRRRRRASSNNLKHNYHYYYCSSSIKMTSSSIPQALLWVAFFILLSNNNNFVTLSHSLEATPANNQPSLNINSIVNREVARKEDQNGLPPVVINQQQDRVVGVGSNISLECTARGKGLTFVWFQDEKNITTSGNSSGAQSSEPASTTKLLEEKRYEIAEEPSPPESNSNVTTSILYLFNLKLTDTSLFLCWVENASGYTITNFSLTVTNDSPPSLLNGLNNRNEPTTDSYLMMFNNKTKHISWVLVLVLVIGLVLLLLFKFILSFKHNNLEHRSNSSESSSSNDLKQQNLHHHQASSVSSHEESAGPNHLHEYGFIEHMRSGIINMDYHSMSPVIQFNQNTSKQQLHQQQQQQQQQQHHHHNNQQQQQQQHQLQQQQQHLHHHQLSAVSLLQHQHNPPMYSDATGNVPDLYHAANAIYNPPGSVLNGQPAGQQALMNHQRHLNSHLHQPQQVAFLPEMVAQQPQQQQQARNNYQRNLDYDRFHIL